MSSIYLRTKLLTCSSAFRFVGVKTLFHYNYLSQKQSLHEMFVNAYTPYNLSRCSFNKTCTYY